MPVTRQAQLLAVVAVTGAALLTAGVILWATGTVMQAGYHGHRAAAGTGEVLIMAGLLCGLCMFVLAANSVRWTPRPAGRPRRALQPLASPEEQAWLADRPPPEAGPLPVPQPRFAPPADAVPPGPVPPGPVPPGPGPGEFPPDRPWPEPGPEPDWPLYPGPPGAGQPYLAPPGPPDPGGNQGR